MAARKTATPDEPDRLKAIVEATAEKALADFKKLGEAADRDLDRGPGPDDAVTITAHWTETP